MMRVLGAGLVFGCVMFASAWGLACEPCPVDLAKDAEQSALEAPLVLVGERSSSVWSFFESDDTIEFKVEKVVHNATSKTIEPGSVLTLNYMDGMCAYGFMLKKSSRVVVFASAAPAEGVHNVVSSGCGVSHVEVSKEGKVVLKDKALTLQELEFWLKQARKSFLDGVKQR